MKHHPDYKRGEDFLEDLEAIRRPPVRVRRDSGCGITWHGKGRV